MSQTNGVERRTNNEWDFYGDGPFLLNFLVKVDVTAFLLRNKSEKA